MADAVDRAWVDSMPAAYDRWLAPAVFRPFAEDLARRVAARSPRHVLELAAGTGVLTRELVAAATTAEIVATDLNAAMVEFGRRSVPEAAWRPADAMDLPFEDGRFDVVACQFGAMFFPAKPAAFGEVRRVLSAAGTFVLNTWATLDTHEFEAALTEALGRVFPGDPPTFFASVPHGYADPGVVAKDLRAAGLLCDNIESVTLSGHAESIAGLVTGYCTGTPLRAAIEARGDLAESIAAITADMERRFGTGAVTGRMTAHVIESTPSPDQRA